jgi:hypothetical protein
MSRKGIKLLGTPTYLYNKGFKVFKDIILKSPVLSKFTSEKNLQNSALNNYKNEYILSTTLHMFEVLEKYKHALVTKDIDAPQNNEFYAFLDEIGYDKEKFMSIIAGIWPDLIDFAGQSSNYTLLEIQNLAD